MEKLDFSYMGPVLKQVRLSAKMTQEEPAERIGRTARFIMAIENEEKGVSLDTLVKQSRALGISADTIVYPEREADNGETEQLIRNIGLLNSRDKSILLAAVTSSNSAFPRLFLFVSFPAALCSASFLVFKTTLYQPDSGKLYQKSTKFLTPILSAAPGLPPVRAQAVILQRNRRLAVSYRQNVYGPSAWWNGPS